MKQLKAVAVLLLLKIIFISRPRFFLYCSKKPMMEILLETEIVDVLQTLSDFVQVQSNQLPRFTSILKCLWLKVVTVPEPP